MRITVAVCTYRRFEWLGKCLEALRQQTLPAAAFSVLVVDNSLDPENSRSFQQALGEVPNLEYIVTERAGLSYARNIAIERCTTPLLAFLDDDALPDPHWLATLCDAFDRMPEAGIVGGRTNPIWERPPPDWLTQPLTHPLAILDWGDEDCRIESNGGRWLVGANIAYRTRLLRAVGGFDERLGRQGAVLMAHEEYAVNQAIQRLGFDMWYLAKATVRHLVQAERSTREWLCKDAFWEGVSRTVLRARVQGVEVPAVHEAICEVLDREMGMLPPTEDKDAILGQMNLLRQHGADACAALLRLGPDSGTPAEAAWPVVYMVTPCLNAAETIDETIRSVVAQAGDFSIRYHVQDGGSTDGTLDILRRWRRALEEDDGELVRCRSVAFSFASAPDKGMYDAVNRGFVGMSMHYMAFMTWLNADDLLLPGAVASILDAARKVEHVNWIGPPITTLEPDGTTRSHRGRFPLEIIAHGACDTLHWPAVQQEGTFFRRWLWDKLGGLNSGLRYAGDWDLWRRMAQINPFVQTTWPLGLFRNRVGQLSKSNNGRNYLAEIEGMLPLEKRRAAVAAFVSQGPNYGTCPTLSRGPDGQYRLESLPIGDALPDQARHFIKSPVPADTGFARQSIGMFAAPPQPSVPWYDVATLHRIYLRSPQWVQRVLSAIKYKVILLPGRMLREYRTKRVLRRSGLFYAAYYLETYPDVAASGMDPVTHYVRFGAAEGRSPNPLFHSKWYLDTYPDVRGMNPLLHYILHGAAEGRDPCWLFSTRGHQRLFRDGGSGGAELLAEFLRNGVAQGVPFKP